MRQVKALLCNVGALGCKRLPAPSKQKVLLIVQVAFEHLKHGLFTLCVSLVFLLSLFLFCSASISPHPSELREGWCVFYFLNTTETSVFFFFLATF